jgi:signal peptidase I
MSEVPPFQQKPAQGDPVVADESALPHDTPRAVAPDAPQRGPFEGFVSERPEPGPAPVRTPWDPPVWEGGDGPAAGPFGPAMPPGLSDPYATGATAATVAPPSARRSFVRPASRLLRELAETVILALVIFLMVRAVVQNFQVEGSSMQPTLETGWYLLVDKALYWEINLKTVHKFLPFVEPGADPTRYIFRGPRRGDIIVFRAPDQTPGAPERDFIKRVIGLSGDTVEVKACTVLINGKPLKETYIAQPPAYLYGPAVVPKGQLFVLGDNRNNSSDSHSWGMLPKENIIGQAWIIYWPFHNFELLNNKKPTIEDTTAAAAKPAAACASS